MNEAETRAELIDPKSMVSPIINWKQQAKPKE
jgi:hypothetical protein